MIGTIHESRTSPADLSAFHEIAHALTSSLDLNSVLHAIMRQVEGLFHPEAWVLLLTDERRRDLCYAIGDVRFGRRLADLRIAYGEGVSGQVAERGEPSIMSDATSEAGRGVVFDARLGLEVRSAISVPLRSRQRTLGVIQLLNLPAESFSEYALSCLTVLSDFAAIAIEHVRAFQSVEELTITDECTGLYNLRHLDSVLPHELARCERLPTSMSLIFVDLDHFKQVNDQYGHQVGSQLLAAVGATLKGQVRSIDKTFRYGGDEFVVLLPDTGKMKAVEVANRLLTTLRKTNHAISPLLRLNVRASIGVSSYPEDGKSAQELLRVADARMYGIKGSSRDGVGFNGLPALRAGSGRASDPAPSPF
jgi:diguanylate cyclase (GGDEF)-like protein